MIGKRESGIVAGPSSKQRRPIADGALLQSRRLIRKYCLPVLVIGAVSRVRKGRSVASR
jgi:hypothetical protein